MTGQISTVRAISGAAAYAITLTDDLGHTWSADEPVDLGGRNSATTPDRLMLSSLGACTAITLQMYAARKKWPLTGIEVELALNPTGKPTAGSDITRRITLKGDLEPDQRQRLLAIADACPMHKLLVGEVRIASSISE